MTSRKISVEIFLKMAESIPVIDVRSPSEFNKGHIPEAINIPLFNDAEREAVGKKYKQEGRVKAVLTGLKSIAPHIASKLEMALEISKTGQLLVHCWRGGMRSEAMAWLFSLGDIDTEVLEGGYKAYRNYIIENLTEKRRIIVLGGMTGSGKTHILRYLEQSGHQVIDLEKLANHKGSAFGSLGQVLQPSTEQFGNLLFDKWNRTSRDLPLWIEDESKNIGSVFIPDTLYQNMQETPVIILKMDIKTRLPRLLDEYSAYPPDDLKMSVMKISKRLGGDKTNDAIKAVEDSDFAKAIEIVLYYYDKTYLYSLQKKNSKNITYVETDSDDIEENASKILQAAEKIRWDRDTYY